MRPKLRGFRPDTVHQLRTAAALTQEGLAMRLGVTRALVGSWEKGRVTPDVSSAVKLARALGTTIHALTDVDPTAATLTDLRSWSGYTRTTAVTATGLSFNMLTALERTVRVPNDDVAAVLADAYGVTAEDIIGAWNRERELRFPSEAES